MTTLAVAEQFQAIYAKYHARIETQLYFWINDRTTAEDLAADVFTKLWQDMSQGGLQLDDINHPYAYLRKRAEFVKLKHFERLAAHRERVLVHEALEDADHSRIEALAASRTQSDTAETVNARVDVGRILAMLPAKQRRVVALRYLEDLDLTTVAEQTGWREGMVKRHTADALNALRQMAGVSTGAERDQSAAERREQMRRTYVESVAAGAPLTVAELARRFGRTHNIANKAVADLLAPVVSINRKAECREELRGALIAGKWAPGATLPSSGELAEQYQVSTGLISKVLVSLAAEGLVMKLTGPGYGSRGRYHATPATGRTELHRVARLAMVMAA
jgi:RNA polymerase sigma factor (sigma-70 family)